MEKFKNVQEMGVGAYWVYDPTNPYNRGLERPKPMHIICWAAASHFKFEFNQCVSDDNHVDNWRCMPDGTFFFVDRDSFAAFNYPKEWRLIILELNSLFTTFQGARDIEIGHYRYGFLQEGGPVAVELLNVLRRKHGLNGFSQLKKYKFVLKEGKIDESNDEDIAGRQAEWLRLKKRYPLGNITRFDNLNQEIPNLLSATAKELGMEEHERIAVLYYYAFKQLAQVRYIDGYKQPLISALISLQHIGMIMSQEMKLFKAYCVFLHCRNLAKHYAPDLNRDNHNIIYVTEYWADDLETKVTAEERKKADILMAFFADEQRLVDSVHLLWCIDDLEEGVFTEGTIPEGIALD